MSFMPFRDSDVFSAFQNHMQQITAEMRALDNTYVLRTSASELEAFFLDKACVEPLTLDTEGLYLEGDRSIQVDARHDPNRFFFPGDRPYNIPGTQITIAVPFVGDPMLWKIRASTYSLGRFPEIAIRGTDVIFTHQFADDAANATQIRERVNELVSSLKTAVDHLRTDVEHHNASASNIVKVELERKRQQAQSASGAVAAIGFPIKRRDQPATYVAPITRRQPPVHRPIPTKDVFKPEPELLEAEFQHILSVIRSLSLVIERNPSSFTTLDEESIRDHILIQINGHYEGLATGETFNSCGKTDILIRVDDRNIFIAECKFWHGPKKFSEAIDQLLGYLAWRDCKCSLIMFNRQKGSSTVVEKMHEAMVAHAGCKKTLFSDVNGNARYVFTKYSDPGREIVVTTMLFDIPVHSAAI